MSFVQDELVGRPGLVRRVFEAAGAVFSRPPRGDEWPTLCPFHDDHDPSLSVNLAKAVYLCRACGAGGDAVEFFAKRRGLTVDAAIADLRDRLGIGRNGGPRPVLKSWEVRAADGTLVAVHEFRGYDERGKKILPWSVRGVRTAELPLYGSERLAAADPSAVVIVTEGEKACDALLERGFVALGTVTGASDTPGLAALEVLRGRDVVLWADYDEPGRAHMARVAAALPGIATSVRVLHWGEVEKDDAADFFARGGTAEQLDAMIADAEEPSPSAGEVNSPLLSRSLLDMDRDPPPPTKWIIEGLVPEHELVLLFGKAFGGKSLFSLQTGLHAAAALTFLPLPTGAGFQIPRPLRVLYVDEEMGEPLLWKRVRLMRSGRPEFNAPEVLERFRVVSRKGLRLDDEARLELLRREISQFPGGAADLVFFDTLRRMHAAAEKDSDLMAQVMGTAIALGEDFGCATIPIHHSKKGPQDDDGDWREAARGSGDLIAASQAIIGMLKTGDCLFTARADAKAGGEISPFPLLLDDQNLLFRRQTEDERLVRKDAQHAVAVKDAQSELLRALGRLKSAGGEKYPPSWTAWREKATGNANTLAEARDLLLAKVDEEGLPKDPEVLKVKRSGKGGGEAYLFFTDREESLFGSRTRSDETTE